jgi:hypothetical protein
MTGDALLPLRTIRGRRRYQVGKGPGARRRPANQHRQYYRASDPGPHARSMQQPRTQENDVGVVAKRAYFGGERSVQRALMQSSRGSQQSSAVAQASSVCEQVFSGGGTHSSMGAPSVPDEV